MLAQLKNLTVDRMDIDDAVELVTFARSAESTYATYQVPAPGWLKAGIDVLDREIKTRRKDMLEARRKEIAATLTPLRTREERKAELEAEAAKLDEALGT